MQIWDPLSDIFQVVGDMFSPISCNDFARFCKQVLISIFNEGTGIGCSRQNWTTNGHSPPAIKVLLAPDHYCKMKWRWTLFWGIILLDVAQIQNIQRDTFPAWTPCWPGLTDKSATHQLLLGSMKIDFMIFLEAEWGTGALRANTNLRINVNNIKHSKRHKMALGQQRDLHRICQGSVCVWNILILLKYTGLLWFIGPYLAILFVVVCGMC